MATRTIGTEIVLSGEKQFNDAMKGVNNNLKTLKSEMALTTAEFAGNEDSVEALTAKQKVLEDSVEQHRAKVDALNDMYEQQKEQYGENSAAADKYKQQLNYATVALLKEEEALEKTTEALESAKKQSDKSSGAVDDLSESLEDQEESIEDVEKKTKDTSNAFKDFVDKLKQTDKTSDGVNKTLKGLGTAASATAKSVGVVATASAAGVAAIAAGGVAMLTAMTGWAREAADAAKTAAESGEELTASQQQWLDYSNKLDSLESGVLSAKNALSSMLLPVLGDLSTTGAAFLKSFSASMTAAAGDTKKQSEVITEYVKKGVTLIKSELPQYLEMGKELISSLLTGLKETGPDVLDMILDLVMDLLDLIFEFAPQLADMGIVLIEKLCQGLAENGPRLIEAAAKMVSTILNGLLNAAPDLLRAGLELIKNIIAGLFEEDIGKTGEELIDTLVGTILECAGVLWDVGKEVATIFVNGIVENMPGLVEFLLDQMGLLDLMNGVWYETTGRWIVTPEEIKGNTPEPAIPAMHKNLGDMFGEEGLLQSFDDVKSGATKANAPSKTVNVTINTSSLSPDEMDGIVDYVNRKLGE